MVDREEVMEWRPLSNDDDGSENDRPDDDDDADGKMASVLQQLPLSLRLLKFFSWTFSRRSV